MRTLAETFITEAILPKLQKIRFTVNITIENKSHFYKGSTKTPVGGTFAITILPAEYAWVGSKEFVK